MGVFWLSTLPADWLTKRFEFMSNAGEGMAYTREAAEVLALGVLGWLLSNDDLLPVFQGATGATEEDIRAGASRAEFLGSVLDFVMQDDAWVIAACDARGVSYGSLAQAREALPGGEQVNWT
jgi:hypothetical protein